MLQNTSTLSKVPDDALHGTGLVIALITGFFIMIVGTIGNGLIVLAFLKTKSLRKPSNVLLVNLAVGDMLFSLFGFLFDIFPDILSHLYCNSTFLSVRIFFHRFFIQLSYGNVLIIALERFIGIRFPYKYVEVVGMKFTYMLSTGSFLLPLVFGILKASRQGAAQNDNAVKSTFESITYIILIASEILTIAIYMYVYKQSRKHLKRDQSFGIVHQESKAVTSVVIAGVYAVSSIPGFIVNFIVQRGVDLDEWGRAPYMFFMLSTCTNLAIYTCRMREFRDAVKELLCTRDNGSRVNPLGNTMV